MIYMANSILDSHSEDKEWYAYLLLCLQANERLSQSWRVDRAISKGLLSMALQKGGISSEKAKTILHDVEHHTPDRMAGNIRATFMLDLDRAAVEPTTATVEYLANQFESNVAIHKYTNLFENEPS